MSGIKLRPEYDSEKISPSIQLRDLIINYRANLTNWHLGEVLTIIDASISDKDQKKAIKNLIKNAVWSREHFTEEYLEELSEWLKNYAIKEAKIETEDDIKKFFTNNY